MLGGGRGAEGRLGRLAVLARGRHHRLLRPHPASRSPTALAFLPWSNSPHHDAEEQRRPLIHRLIADGTLPDGYATENGTGLVFFGTELQDAFTEVEGKLAYSLTRDGAVTREVALDTRLL